MIGLAAEGVQCKERSEVQLQQTAAVNFPFRVATFNVLVSAYRLKEARARPRLCAELAVRVVCGLKHSAMQTICTQCSPTALQELIPNIIGNTAYEPKGVNTSTSYFLLC
jgi:hypothetical protein